MAYATLADYELQTNSEVDPSDEDHVTQLLENAGVMLDAEVPHVDVSDPTQMALLRMVSCSMVSRAVAEEGIDATGISQMSYTMGPFSQSATMSNPSGGMWLTAGERRMLGIGSTSISNMRPQIGPRPRGCGPC